MSTKAVDKADLADKTWSRYMYCRDNGHVQWAEVANRCQNFYIGEQWSTADKARLNSERRPAITVNRVYSTMNTLLGELINNRSEALCRPKNGAPSEQADVMTKVLKQIADNNQLAWLRSQVCRDGVITGRGFYDVRLAYNDSMQGEVRIETLNQKNVILDPDADGYDPDTWNEVFVTKWLTVDDIEVLYGKKHAEELRSRTGNLFAQRFDGVDDTMPEDRFGTQMNTWYDKNDKANASVTRNIRVLERQHRVLDKQRHFLNLTTGDTRPVPLDMPQERIDQMVREQGLEIVERLVRRIRWTVVADDVVLHDEFSPFRHFTVVPFFPVFIAGKTMGMVENLVGPQEMLNKVLSQELHVVNTTANSGWKFKTGVLANMTPAEFERKGAQTGLTIEVNGDIDDVQKITPNAVPAGLSAIGARTEEHIKGVSGVSDSMQGTDREDVAAKAIQTKRKAGTAALAVVEDNLNRTEYILARNVLDMVQEYYTEPRILTITHNATVGDVEAIEVNQPTAEGQILNDLTAGEYAITVVSVPHRDTLEDSQFEQLVALRELGIQIPDDALIEASRVQNKADIIQTMRGDTESEEAQAQAALEQRMQEASVAKLEAEGQQKFADAGLRQAKAQAALEPKSERKDALAEQKAVAEQGLKERQLQHQREMDIIDRQQKQQEQEQELQKEAREQKARQATDFQAKVRESLETGGNTEEGAEP